MYQKFLSPLHDEEIENKHARTLSPLHDEEIKNKHARTLANDQHSC